MATTNRQLDESETTADVLLQAEQLVIELRQGNDQQVNVILQKISEAKDASLYSEVGKMTRQLHDSLENFRQDKRLTGLVKEDIPDARARLTYVITMTEEAAEKTLTAVESTIPVADGIHQKSMALHETWKKFRHRELTANDFRELTVEIDEFLEKITDDSTNMKERLNDILMAQSFQDITGQIIKQVITLVEEVEKNMVQLVKLTSDKYSSVTEVVEEVNSTDKMGPKVPGVGNSDRMQNQDDVDDLLSSLGF